MTPPLPTLHIDTRERERPNPNGPARVSGVDMLKLFQSHPSHPVCVGTTLDAGDFCFSGEGPDVDSPVMIGIERKRLKDMLNSIRSGRFSGEQLPKLLSKYDYINLVIEGTEGWRTNFLSGVLEERWGREWRPVTLGRSAVLGLELESVLNDITGCTPVRVRFTRDPKDTVLYVLSLLHSWAKPWGKRNHHVGIHEPEKYATLGKAGTVRRVAFTLDGVGWERSGAIEEQFRTVEQLVTATPGEIGKLPGFGKVLSKRVWDQLHGEYEEKGLE